MKTKLLFVAALLGAVVVHPFALAQEKPGAGGKKKAQAKAVAGKKAGGKKAKGNARGKGQGKVNATRRSLTFERAKLPGTKVKGEIAALVKEGHHLDFPVGAVDAKGRLTVAYVDHDGNQDVLWLAREAGGVLKPLAPVSAPGVVHQPAIAFEDSGVGWCFWGESGKDGVVVLKARSFAGRVGERTVVVAASKGSNSFADAGTDAAGRVWVAWQSMRAGEGDVFCRYVEDGNWSEEIAVSTEPGGDWEPRLAFDDDAAWVVYDSSRGNEFNVYLARVDAGGAVETFPVSHTERYEGRASIARTADGEGFWIAMERGKRRWGLDGRQHSSWNGINSMKEVVFGRFDTPTKSFKELEMGDADVPVGLGSAVNLPVVGLDGEGNPWLAYRYYDTVLWGIAVTRFDLESKRWSAPTKLPKSSFGQDRRSIFAGGAKGLRLLWPSDLRTTKKVRTTGVYLGAIDTGAELAAASREKKAWPDLYTPKEYAELSDYTPERSADDRHEWEFGGEKFALYWGDVHRHTDVSNCRTGFDGCIVEHFRYAYDMGKLDFLGTSDHTDIGKPYDPYEWWHNQRMADVFQTPGSFTSLYVYEREQKWPWGHRNVVFAERGGPIIYIKRALYRESRYQEALPVKTSVEAEISPEELWDLLKRSGKKVAVISHTGASSMGTDWSRYENGIDYDLENVVEIYQGARVSYEGIDVPQPPTVIGRMPLSPEGPLPTEREKVNFGDKAPGVYQNALAQGHNLGIFTSSDHLSEHVSYGGVYVKEFTRDGILEGLKARRTIAATDKIYLEFSCEGEILGSMFETAKKPRLTIVVDGTAPIARVTIVRNEENYKIFNLRDYKFETTWTDEKPLKGENRYYVRVEQWDGNMAWASPVWVDYTGK